MTPAEEIAALKARIAELERRANVADDISAVRRLQFTYGYFMDKCLWQEVVDLFAEDGELNFMGAIWRGKKSVARLYIGRLGGNFTKGHNGPIDGLLTEYPQMQDIIDILPDGKTALGRFRYLQMAGSHVTKRDMAPYLPQQWWEAGTYENTYVKEGGVWKIKVLRHHLAWQADYQTGWRYSQPAIGGSRTRYPEDPLGPDELIAEPQSFWPKASIQPFHFAHPVTGKPIWPNSK